MLETYPSIRSTFYVTARFAEACPELIRKLTRFGEVASHGYSHSDFTPQDAAESKAVLERITQRQVYGFRMPRMADAPEALLAAAGYSYDSSLNPAWIPGRYNGLRKPAAPFQHPSGLIELPASVTPLLRIPLFWLSFKHLPLPLFCALAKWTLRSRGFLNLYWHPWEFTAGSRNYRIPQYILRHAGGKNLRRLDTLIKKSLSFKGRFLTASEFTAHQIIKK